MVAQAVAVSALAAAVSKFFGVGSLVMTTNVGVNVPNPGSFGALGVTSAIGSETEMRKMGI